MNSITPDPYTNELLSKISLLQPGLAIQRDVYADDLLNYVHKSEAKETLQNDKRKPDKSEPE